LSSLDRDLLKEGLECKYLKQRVQNCLIKSRECFARLKSLSDPNYYRIMNWFLIMTNV